MRGRVIEALGLIGDKSAAAPVVTAAAGCAALMAPIAPDDSTPQAPEVDLCRLALFTLVRLGDRDALRTVALDAEGRAAARWWPVAYALQRGGAPDAGALLALVSTDGVYTPAFALRALYGEAAEAAILASQRVRPAKLLASGFSFMHPTLEPALRFLLGR